VPAGIFRGGSSPALGLAPGTGKVTMIADLDVVEGQQGAYLNSAHLSVDDRAVVPS
jgi:hypothetical protein